MYDLRLLFGKIKVKVGFDRLALLALLDRSVSLAEASASVILAVGVAVMTGLVLNQNHYQGRNDFLKSCVNTFSLGKIFEAYKLAILICKICGKGNEL